MIAKKYFVRLIDINLLGFRTVKKFYKLILLNISLFKIINIFVQIFEIVLNFSKKSN